MAVLVELDRAFGWRDGWRHCGVLVSPLAVTAPWRACCSVWLCTQLSLLVRAATLRAVRRCRRTLERRFDKLWQVFARQAVTVMILLCQNSKWLSQPSGQIDETTIAATIPLQTNLLRPTLKMF